MSTATEIRMKMEEGWRKIATATPHVMLVGKVAAAMLGAHFRFRGRDRRRIKREVNKAIRKTKSESHTVA